MYTTFFSINDSQDDTLIGSSNITYVKGTRFQKATFLIRQLIVCKHIERLYKNNPPVNVNQYIQNIRQLAKFFINAHQVDDYPSSIIYNYADKILQAYAHDKYVFSIDFDGFMFFLENVYPEQNQVVSPCNINTLKALTHFDCMISMVALWRRTTTFDLNEIAIYGLPEHIREFIDYSEMINLPTFKMKDKKIPVFANNQYTSIQYAPQYEVVYDVMMNTRRIDNMEKFLLCVPQLCESVSSTSLCYVDSYTLSDPNAYNNDLHLPIQYYLKEHDLWDNKDQEFHLATKSAHTLDLRLFFELAHKHYDMSITCVMSDLGFYARLYGGEHNVMISRRNELSTILKPSIEDTWEARYLKNSDKDKAQKYALEDEDEPEEDESFDDADDASDDDSDSSDADDETTDDDLDESGDDSEDSVGSDDTDEDSDTKTDEDEENPDANTLFIDESYGIQFKKLKEVTLDSYIFIQEAKMLIRSVIDNPPEGMDPTDIATLQWYMDMWVNILSPDTTREIIMTVIEPFKQSL